MDVARDGTELAPTRFAIPIGDAVSEVGGAMMTEECFTRSMLGKECEGCVLFGVQSGGTGGQC